MLSSEQYSDESDQSGYFDCSFPGAPVGRSTPLGQAAGANTDFTNCTFRAIEDVSFHADCLQVRGGEEETVAQEAEQGQGDTTVTESTITLEPSESTPLHHPPHGPGEACEACDLYILNWSK